MKALLIFWLAFGTLGTVSRQEATIGKGKEASDVKQTAKKLELSITPNRHKYKRGGKIRLNAMLINAGYVNDTVVYGTLGWGHLASLTITLRDSSGKRIQPSILADELTPPISRDDTASFVKLSPRHFLGTYFVEELDSLGLNTPGKYSIFVEYHCPISSTKVSLRNFWSKEDGTIRSNTVWIEVVP